MNKRKSQLIRESMESECKRRGIEFSKRAYRLAKKLFNQTPHTKKASL